MNPVTEEKGKRVVCARASTYLCLKSVNVLSAMFIITWHFNLILGAWRCVCVFVFLSVFKAFSLMLFKTLHMLLFSGVQIALPFLKFRCSSICVT